jgi:hypothetical protein
MFARKDLSRRPTRRDMVAPIEIDGPSPAELRALVIRLFEELSDLNCAVVEQARRLRA